jgi:magnesium transporter
MVGESPSAPPSIRSVTANGFSWVSVERPTRSESDEVCRRYDLLPSDVETALDRRQTPRIVRRERYLFVVVHVPLAPSGGQRRGLVISPVAICVRPDSLLTFHDGEIRPLMRLFRQLEADASSRDAAFAVGVEGVLFSIVQRLVDAMVAARERLDQAISIQEGEILRSPTPSTIEVLAQLRREARVLRRLIAPLPTLIRELGEIDLGLATKADWAHLALRPARLVEALDDDVDALREILAATSVAATLRGTAHLQVLTVVVTTTLPVLAVMAILAMLPENPLAGQANNSTVRLAVAGVVFLGALLTLRRRGII